MSWTDIGGLNSLTTSAREKKIMGCIGKGGSVMSFYLTDNIKRCINENVTSLHLSIVAFIHQSCPCDFVFTPQHTLVCLFPLLLFLVGIKLGLNPASGWWAAGVTHREAELQDYVLSYEILQPVFTVRPRPLSTLKIAFPSALPKSPSLVFSVYGVRTPLQILPTSLGCFGDDRSLAA